MQNLTKCIPGYYRAHQDDGPGSILGYRFEFLGEKQVEGEDVVEGMSPRLNVRRGITVPDTNEWYLCLSLKTEVETNKGFLKLQEVIEKAGVGEEIWVRTPISWRRVLGGERVGKRKAFKISLPKGQIICSGEHRFLVRKFGKLGFMSARDLRKGDLLVGEEDKVTWSELEECLLL
jgi:hypothetical protein